MEQRKTTYELNMLNVATLILFTLKLCGVFKWGIIVVMAPMFLDFILYLLGFEIRPNMRPVEIMTLIVITLKLCGIMQIGWLGILVGFAIGEMIIMIGGDRFIKKARQNGEQRHNH